VHFRIIEGANTQQLKNFLFEAFSRLKSYDKTLYDEMELELYESVYGNHFNEWLLNKAKEEMENEDGTKGEHWKLEETNEVAKQHNIAFNNFNQYDFNYVMNMLYSDYCHIINDTTTYVRMAKAFLCDKDGIDGKAFKYYIMNKGY